MPLIKELTAKAGTYTDKQTGAEKTRYVRVGSMFSGERGEMLKLESLPIGFDGWIYLRDPLPKDDAPQPQRKPARSVDADSDIPFADPYKGRRSHVV